ncbi:ferric reduction oxidase 7, chloroplastic-like [Nymphaea colorata]|nr:ferric reduction oxidase 7, chloroplastic-like [Nymphaea colorata]
MYFQTSMEGNSPWEPFLAEDGGDDGLLFRSAQCLKVCLSCSLKLLMVAIFLTWVVFVFLLPTDFMGKLLAKWISMTNTTVYGSSGVPFLLFSAPVLAIALLGAAYLAFFPTEYNERKKKRLPSFRVLWTHPVIVKGPLGVVSAAELIGIIAFAAYILWALPAYMIRDYTSGPFLAPSGTDLVHFGRCFSRRLGAVGFFCVAFLLIPTARGSILLRVLDIPFEHAIRYHKWLGHVTLILLTLHGLVVILIWIAQGTLQAKIILWQTDGIAHCPGAVSLLAGLLMWLTSLSPVRRKRFELFYYTHQLYAVFIIFAALHVGINLFYIIAGSVFLFIMDRFLRFWQSRTTVDVLSAKCFPCGAVELTLSKPKNMTYNPLNFVFLQVREVSWFQWHPFSVSSSSLDGRSHLTVLIKVAGKWTQKLRDEILNARNHASGIRAAVEGPYGYRSLYHLQYENLILVAGGSGISPFFSILKDMLHGAKEEKYCLPKKILLVWSVKRSEDLSLLSEINVTSICAFPLKVLDIEIQAYVTRESGNLQEGGNCNSGGEIVRYIFSTRGSSMSTMVGSGNMKWLGIYMFFSIFGFVALEGVAELVLGKLNISNSWLNGLLCIICMLASIILFGGPVIMLWRLWESSGLEFVDDDEQQEDVAGLNGSTQYGEDASKDLLSLASIHYGRRPNYKEIFSSISEKWGNVDVGVVVCGPPGLEASVAAHCKSIRNPVFHFHSYSFEF